MGGKRQLLRLSGKTGTLREQSVSTGSYVSCRHNMSHRDAKSSKVFAQAEVQREKCLQMHIEAYPKVTSTKQIGLNVV